MEDSITTTNFIDKPIFPNIDSKWCGTEEILLLDCIKRHGYNNWDKISEIMEEERPGKKFPPEEIGKHFEEVYVDGNIGKEIWHHESMCEKSRICDDISSDSLNIGDINAHRNLSAGYHNLIEYIPLREDFKFEYENDAEEKIRDLEIKDSDTDFQKRIKMAMLDSYLDVVRERSTLKSFITSHRLAEQFFFNGEEIMRRLRIRGKHPKVDCNGDLTWLLPLCRFFSSSEFQYFYDHVLKERKIQKRIEELTQLMNRVDRGIKVEFKGSSVDLEDQDSPFFLNVDAIPDENLVYRSPRRRFKKRKLLFTRRKGGK